MHPKKFFDATFLDVPVLSLGRIFVVATESVILMKARSHKMGDLKTKAAKITTQCQRAIRAIATRLFHSKRAVNPFPRSHPRFNFRKWPQMGNSHAWIRSRVLLRN